VGEVVAAVLPLAVVVAVSPVPVLAVVLMLLTPRAGVTGPGFLVGWVAGIAGVTALFVVLAGDRAPGGAGRSSAAASWIELVLGVLLLVLAARQYRTRPVPGTAQRTPAWLVAVDRFTAVRAGVLGLVVSAANPKILLVCVAAGLTIADGGLPGAQDAWSVVAFTGAAASTVAVPVLAHSVGRRRMAGLLQSLRGWLTVHGTAVTVGLLLLLGVVLVGQGLGGLT
jgi:threonine/homoserine/homoserine lactone efflux protein